MAKIKSIRSVVFEPKKQEQGTIMIEVNSPIHDVLSGAVRCTLNYYCMEESRMISTETWNLTNEEKEMLLETCLSDFNNIDNLLTQFLLNKFRADSVYGILPEEWEELISII